MSDGARPVVTHDARWCAAIAELPRSLRPGDAPRGAVVVEPGGAGWGERAVAAARAGAAAVIVDDPAPDADETTTASDARIPVILHRPRLRPDLLEAVRAQRVPGPLIQIEAGCPPPQRAGMLADAMGWARVLAAGVDAATPAPPILTHAASTATGLLALVEAGGGSLGAVISVVRADLPWLRATVIGPERLVIDMDRAIVVETARADGVLTLPRLRESPERASLRRALRILGDPAGEADDDLVDFAADLLLATAATPRNHQPALYPG